MLLANRTRKEGLDVCTICTYVSLPVWYYCVVSFKEGAESWCQRVNHILHVNHTPEPRTTQAQSTRAQSTRSVESYGCAGVYLFARERRFVTLRRFYNYLDDLFRRFVN